jgi:murein DD-endopeptidase MepM/ murein hydrolase activator NlpD
MTRFSIFAMGSLFGASCVVFVVLMTKPAPQAPAVVIHVPPAAASSSAPATTAAPTASIARVELGSAPAAPVSDLKIPMIATPATTAVAASTEMPLALSPQSPLTSLLIPVTGVKPDELSDTFSDARSNGRVHDAIDIMAPRGTAVVAAGDGKVVKLFNSKQGGLTLYQFDPGETYAYYYAHLDSYAPGIGEGRQLRRGDLVGFVGSSGNASPDAPHLHFAIFVLGPEKHWWQGTAINPYPLLTGQRSQPIGVLP